VRWGIGVLLGAGALINYFDRINLSVGAPQPQQEFGLTDGEHGWLLSGFFWSYALLQIPTGMILERFAVTSAYRSYWPSASSPTSSYSAGWSRSRIRRRREASPPRKCWGPSRSWITVE
jgi:MFS family permease